MFFKIITVLSSATLAFAIKSSTYDLSNSDKNLIEAFSIIRNESVKIYSLRGFNLISIYDSQNMDLYEKSRLGLIQAGFNAESIQISYNDVKNANSKINSVFMIDNIKVFQNFEHQINSRIFGSMGLHFVILLDGKLKDVHEIFNIFWSKTIFNVMALLNENGTVLLSFEPYADSKKCGDTTPKIINRYENGKFTKTLELKRSFNNMNRCSISVTTFLGATAVFKEQFSNGSFILRGHEIHLIKTISKMLNFTLKVKFRDGARQWGIVYENGTCTKAFKELKDRKTDILIGNLYLREARSLYFESSAAFLNYPVVFVLSHEKKLNGFEKLLSPLQSFVWIALLLTFCCGVAVIFIINIKFKFLKKFVYGEKVKHPITNLFAALIGLPQTAVPKRNFARFIFMMFLILSLIIRSVYQGFLYKFLQSDGRYKEPQTIDELIEKEYTFVTGETSVDMIKKYHPRIYKNLKISSANVENDLDSIIGTSDRTAAFASLTEIMYYSLYHKGFSYKICKEYFYTVNVAMYFNKNFFLKDAIDEAIRKILIHGFMIHWMKEFDGMDRWRHIDKGPAVMTFEHLSGAFYLLITGYIVAFLMVLGEIVVFKFNLINV